MGQKLARNWAIVYQGMRLMETKEEFIIDLRETTAEILYEREQAKAKRLNALRGEHAEESYKTLKSGVRYAFFILFTAIFFTIAN